MNAVVRPAFAFDDQQGACLDQLMLLTFRLVILQLERGHPEAALITLHRARRHHANLVALQRARVLRERKDGWTRLRERLHKPDYSAAL